MDRKHQHLINAAKEKHWIDDAKRDQVNLTKQGHQLIRQGKTIEGNFDLQEARNAGSWVNKRQAILRKEERLAGK
ncbi:MAG: hypothetical protein M0Q91_05240 [Methanoregula sp.]|jgi:hypothetical protein|nr:hypothetical protein [Methanoregula sp.]